MPLGRSLPSHSHYAPFALWVEAGFLSAASADSPHLRSKVAAWAALIFASLHNNSGAND